MGDAPESVEERLVARLNYVPRMLQCLKCGQASLLRQEGCDSCTEYHYSKYS
jgi:hypothetical protein